MVFSSTRYSQIVPGLHQRTEEKTSILNKIIPVGRPTVVAFECRNCLIINIRARTSPVAIETKGRDYGALQKNLTYGLALFSVWHSKLDKTALDFPDLFF